MAIELSCFFFNHQLMSFLRTAVTLWKKHPDTQRPQWPVMLRTLALQNACTETCTCFCVYDLCTVYICIHISDILSFICDMKDISHMSYHDFVNFQHGQSLRDDSRPQLEPMVNHPQCVTIRGIETLNMGVVYDIALCIFIGL